MPVDSPPIICPSCQRPATWKHAEDGHAESCYQCGSCGSHYSRQRESVYVPVGMSREDAERRLEEPTDEETKARWKQLEDAGYIPKGPTMDDYQKELVNELAGSLGEVLRPYLLGKVINPEYKAEVAARNKLCRWCDPQVNDDPDTLGLCAPHAINLLDENKRHIKTENHALEELWRFVDIVSAKPRQGNVFARALEALGPARSQRDGWEWLIRIKELMVGPGGPVDGEKLRGQVMKLLQRVGDMDTKLHIAEEALQCYSEMDGPAENALETLRGK